MTDIQVRGTTDPDAIAVVVALLARESVPSTTPQGVSAWQQVRRTALAHRMLRRPQQRS